MSKWKKKGNSAPHAHWPTLFCHWPTLFCFVWPSFKICDKTFES